MMYRRYLWPMAAHAVLLLIGLALLVAPFALRYQPAGAHWTSVTETSFWSGVGLLVFACVGLLGWVSGLRRELSEALLAAEVREAKSAAKPATAEPSRQPQAEMQSPLDTDEVLRRLALTVLRDLEERV